MVTSEHNEPKPKTLHQLHCEYSVYVLVLLREEQARL
jgi:hypothetical protein